MCWKDEAKSERGEVAPFSLPNILGVPMERTHRLNPLIPLLGFLTFPLLGLLAHQFPPVSACAGFPCWLFLLGFLTQGPAMVWLLLAPQVHVAEVGESTALGAGQLPGIKL